MGIKDFSKVFTPVDEVNIKDLPPGTDLAIDAYIEIFSSAFMQYATGLTNPQGEPTTHINVALANIVKRLILDADDIWVFDARDPRAQDDPKKFVLQERKQAAEVKNAELDRAQQNLDKMVELESKFEKSVILQMQPNFDKVKAELTTKVHKMQTNAAVGNNLHPMINSIIFMLDCLGVRWTVAPVGIDAEELSAQLCMENQVDGVITQDTDTLVYGAPFILRKKRKKAGEKTVKPGTYVRWTRQACLSQHGLTPAQFAEVAVALGCDFAPKVSGVGPASVIKKVKGSLSWTPEQERAMGVFNRPKNHSYQLNVPTCTDQSINKLESWLVRDQGFKADRVAKILEPLRKKYKF